jgi:hypothetical protein
MPSKSFQFRISTLMWLVVVSALVLGTLRYVQTASGGGFQHVLTAALFTGPLVWLFLRPNPFRGHRRVKPLEPCDPAAPIDARLRQFINNVSPVDVPAGADRPLLLPLERPMGKAARQRSEFALLLRRIYDKPAIKSPATGSAFHVSGTGATTDTSS